MSQPAVDLMGRGTLHNLDCLDAMRTMPSGCVDSIVTDPPAGISFMNAGFDSDRGGRDHWVAWLAERLAEGRRVIRPGGFMLCWAIPRTSHWTAMAIEEAGWTIRDRIAHLFGTGYPKSKSCLKPAVEDWFRAINSVDPDILSSDVIEANLLVEAWLWLTCPAKLAETGFWSSLPGPTKQNSAQLLAATWLAAKSDERSEMMATFNSPEEGLTFWSIACLWSGILGENSRSPSTSTTETKTRVATALRTLNCFLSASIQDDTTQELLKPSGSRFHARLAGKLCEDFKARWISTHAHSVTKPVTLGVINTLASAVEMLSLRIAMRNGVTVPENVTTVDSPAVEDWWLCKAPGKLLPLQIQRSLIGGPPPSVPQPATGGRLFCSEKTVARSENMSQAEGRWPANLVLSHGACEDECVEACPVRMLGEQSGTLKSGKASAGGHIRKSKHGGKSIFGVGDLDAVVESPAGTLFGDTGTAARFFYQAKCSTADRQEGCEGLPNGNNHPTPKSSSLMAHLVKLITPEGGTVLDPFAGSGSTGKACMREGFRFIGCESDTENGYFEIARRRIEYEIKKSDADMPLFAKNGGVL